MTEIALSTAKTIALLNLIKTRSPFPTN